MVDWLTAATRLGRVHAAAQLWQRALLLSLSMWALSQPSAHAQPAHQVGLGGAAMRGLDHIGMPLQGDGMALALGTGYGFTERFDDIAGASHRVLGRAAIAAGLTEFLAIGAELNGHLDAHPGEEDVAYVSAIGEPRFMARLGFEPATDIQLGTELAIRLPGAAAPSLRLAATTAELLGQLALLQLNPLSLHAQAGFRLDNSAEVAPDLNRLRQGDRIGLGLSSAHQVLLAFGAHYAFSYQWQTFLEGSWDVLIKHAKALESPLRLTIGGRYGHPDALSLELTATFALSKRPEVGPTMPLIPIEPRVQVMFGMRYAFSGLPQPTAEEQTNRNTDQPAEPAPATSGPLWGTLTDGLNAPVAGALVTLETPIGGPPLTATSDDRGRFEFDDVPFGDVQLTARAEGFDGLSWSAQHSLAESTMQPQVLLPSPTLGQLRSVIRSWNSEPLAADVVVKDDTGHEVYSGTADATGSLTIDLPPGRYEVQISAQGQQTQKRRVRLRDRGVTILNIDLRPRSGRKR